MTNISACRKRLWGVVAYRSKETQIEGNKETRSVQSSLSLLTLPSLFFCANVTTSRPRTPGQKKRPVPSCLYNSGILICPHKCEQIASIHHKKLWCVCSFLFLTDLPFKRICLNYTIHKFMVVYYKSIQTSQKSTEWEMQVAFPLLSPLYYHSKLPQPSLFFLELILTVQWISPQTVSVHFFTCVIFVWPEIRISILLLPPQRASFPITL